MARLKKGDMVMVRSGKDRGKRGKILSLLPKRQAALVERVNLAKHFDRRSQENQAGGIIEREAPLALDKLALLCPRCGRPSRVSFRVSDGRAAGETATSKQRICKRCQEAL